MSYSRWTEDCNVYTYRTTGKDGTDMFECCGCCMEGHSVQFKTKKEMLKHLENHRDNGDKVPDYVFENIKNGCD
ncbi:MAG: hypothetical protein ACOCTT_03500 [archaeon]